MKIREIYNEIKNVDRDGKVIAHIYYKKGDETISMLPHEEIDIDIVGGNLIISIKAWE